MNREIIERELVVRIFQLSNQLQLFIDKKLKGQEITAKQFYLMIIIGNMPKGSKIGDIAKFFKSSRQNIMQLILKLEKNDFVRVEVDKKDTRIKRVYLTQKANEFWQKREDEDKEYVKEIFNNQSTHNLQTTNNTVSSIIINLEEL